jgi:hypothetical protein
MRALCLFFLILGSMVANASNITRDPDCFLLGVYLEARTLALLNEGRAVHAASVLAGARSDVTRFRAHYNKRNFYSAP